MSRCGGSDGIRASSPAGETGMSEQAGADLPEAKDGEGQLSEDALRAPAPGDAPVFHRNQPAGTAQMLRRYAVANALSAFTRYLPTSKLDLGAEARCRGCCRGDIGTPEPRRAVTRPNESGCRFVAYPSHFAAKTLGTGGKNRILGGRR